MIDPRGGQSDLGERLSPNKFVSKTTTLQKDTLAVTLHCAKHEIHDVIA